MEVLLVTTGGKTKVGQLNVAYVSPQLAEAVAGLVDGSSVALNTGGRVGVLSGSVLLDDASVLEWEEEMVTFEIY